jgi:hypothetical protein
MRCVQWIGWVQYNGCAVHHMASGVCSVWCVQCMVCAMHTVCAVHTVCAEYGVCSVWRRGGGNLRCVQWI